MLERRTADFSEAQRRSPWPQCRTCARRRNRELRDRLGPSYTRARHLQRFYGLTLEDVQAMRARQEERCPICAEPLDPADDQAAIDHCYRTGLVRGVLHPTCNAGLGHFYDDPERLRRAADYLEAAKRRQHDADAKFIPAQRLGCRPGDRDRPT
ncbi:MAG: endonuclease VII domain-containing protein [Actinobacteria bacterium]|nr:endonuclease VII domain-containing protein [Actinomycetota bacterium]